jgi:hypothetical protein
MLQLVTTGVGRGPYPTPYPVRCRPCAQSRGLGTDSMAFLLAFHHDCRVDDVSSRGDVE